MGPTLSKHSKSKSKKPHFETVERVQEKSEASETPETPETPQTVKLEEMVDKIAASYIVTMDTKTLQKLNEPSYCDEIMTLTSDILEKEFTHLEVQKIASRVHDGVTIISEFDVALPGDPDLQEDTIFFLKKDAFKEDPIQKRETCNEIAKFYVKIAHLFAAIMKTVNPEYIYKDFFGNIIRTREKESIPKNTEFHLYKLNLCNKRLNALLGKTNIDEMAYLGTDEKKVEVQPDFCSVHVKSNGEIKTLEEEPGIPELMNLYYDADYDYKTGEFRGMTDSTKKEYQQDLELFYRAFTGSETVPSTIKNFGDIKLKDYDKSKFCGKVERNERKDVVDGQSNVKFTGNYRDGLFNLYSRNIGEMIYSVNDKQERLLDILGQVFWVDDKNPKSSIKIEPSLTENKLQQLVVDTRQCISEMYIQCERDFVEGIKIFEAIVEVKMFETTQKQIETLEKYSEKLYGK
jgi:hypothetical protein